MTGSGGDGVRETSFLYNPADRSPSGSTPPGGRVPLALCEMYVHSQWFAKWINARFGDRANNLRILVPAFLMALVGVLAFTALGRLPRTGTWPAPVPALAALGAFTLGAVVVIDLAVILARALQRAATAGRSTALLLAYGLATIGVSAAALFLSAWLPEAVRGRSVLEFATLWLPQWFPAEGAELFLAPPAWLGLLALGVVALGAVRRFRATLLGRIVRPLIFPTYCVAIVVVPVYVFCWRPYLREMRHTARPKRAMPELPRHMDRATLLRLGHWGPARPSSFVHYPLEKPAGVVRLCAFGDSWTYGTETAPPYDYAAFLEGLFRAHGADNVQVLNFGADWYGGHQAYILWDAVGRRMDCDCVLLGPYAFQPKRDTAFNHTDDVSPYYLHARFVLEGEGLRLVEVAGDDLFERFAQYYRFVPRWRYARYERRLPVLQSLLPKGYTIRNPLYYTSLSMDEEALATYKPLFRRFAATTPQVVLLHIKQDVVDTATGLGLPNLLARRFDAPNGFPYRAPERHMAPLGNRVVAEHFFAAVTGAPEARVRVIETGGAGPGADRAAVPVASHGTPLARIERVAVETEGHTVGYLVAQSLRGLVQGWAGAFPARSVHGLLLLRRADEAPMQSRAAAVDAVLQGGERLELRVGRGAAESRCELGSVRLLHPELNVGDAIMQRPETTSCWEGASAEARRAARIFVGKTPVLRAGAVANPPRFAPIQGGWLCFRPNSNASVPPEELPDAGTFELAFMRDDGDAIRIPFATWRMREDVAANPTTGLAQRIVIRDGRAVAEPVAPH